MTPSTLLTERHATSASSAVTVATPNDVATVELNPGGANVIRGHVGAHTNHFLEPPKRGEDTDPRGVPEHDPAPRGRPHASRCSTPSEATRPTRRASAATWTSSSPGSTAPRRSRQW